jgi:phytoene desaturase
MGAFRSLGAKVGDYFHDRRTQRLFSFQSLYAGLAPQRALALYAVITYLDSVRGVHFPRGGMHAVPQAMAAAATKHGVTFRYDTTVIRVETYAGRAHAVHTSTGERIVADAVVLNPDLPVAYRDLLPAATPLRRLGHLRYSPSCVVVHIGSSQPYRKIAHHNLHFGRAWTGTFDDVIRRGVLMRDPSLLVTNPTRSDPSLAPKGKHVYYVLAPVPHLHAGGPDARTWHDKGLGERYADQLIATLEARGYVGFGAGIRTRRIVTPADWEAMGHAAGTPFAEAHTFRQTGPFRPSNLHPTLSNVVFVGSGTQPGVGVPMVLISGKLAAQRVTGQTRARAGRARRPVRGRRLSHRHRRALRPTFTALLGASVRRRRHLLRSGPRARPGFRCAKNACCGRRRGMSVWSRRAAPRRGTGITGFRRPVGVYTYRAADPATGRVEHEYDHVVVGQSAASSC